MSSDAKLSRLVARRLATRTKTPGDAVPSPQHKQNLNGKSWKRNKDCNVRSLAVAGIVILLALVLARRVSLITAKTRISDEFAFRLRSFDIPVLPSSLPTTYAISQANYSRTSVSSQNRAADTTAVILNWSRLENVLLISALLCGSWLEDVIAEVFVWNNNPNVTLTTESFEGTGCPPEKLHIYNSPENMLFQARYLACANARTHFCFTQDDDYLVQPEVIKNLRSYALQNGGTHSLHLLPAHEHLLSRLRMFTSKDDSIRTAFAWLGHGTYLTRSSAAQFLDLLRALNVTDDEMKMADNYFTILANRPKADEIWFDHGIELGGGQPFTVGSEGEDRNDKHIARALEYLSLLVSGQHPASNHLYLSQPRRLESPFFRNVAPCRIESCIVMSNIDLLPEPERIEIREISVDSVTRRNLRLLDEVEKECYIEHPLSNMVDAHPQSEFRSPRAAKAGDWIILDALGILDRALELSFLTGYDVERMFRQEMSFSTSIDAKEWIDAKNPLNCVQVQHDEDGAPLVECSVKLEQPAEYFRLMLTGPNIDSSKWGMHEIWLRYV